MLSFPKTTVSQNVFKITFSTSSELIHHSNVKKYKFDFQRGCFNLHFAVWKIKPILLNWLNAENKSVGRIGRISASLGYSSGQCIFYVLLGSDDVGLSLKTSNITFSYMWQLPLKPNSNWGIKAAPWGYFKGGWVWLFVYLFCIC